MRAADAGLGARERLRRALASLEARERMLLALTRLDGLDATEAAAVLGCTAAEAERDLILAERKLARRVGAAAAPWCAAMNPRAARVRAAGIREEERWRA